MEAERVLNDLYKKINETGCEGRLPVAIFRVEKNILTYSGWKWRFVPTISHFIKWLLQNKFRVVKKIKICYFNCIR